MIADRQKGYIDEFRVSATARWPTDINPNTGPCNSSGFTYTGSPTAISPEEYRKEQLKKKYKMFWDEGMSDRQIIEMMKFLETKLDVNLPKKKVEDFLDAELFEM